MCQRCVREGAREGKGGERWKGMEGLREGNGRVGKGRYGRVVREGKGRVGKGRE